MDKQYSVYVENNGSVLWAQSLRWVDLDTAIVEARVRVQSGVYHRVFITDGGDCINFDWNAVEGVIFPRAEDFENPEAKAEWDKLFPPSTTTVFRE